jgi:serine/threonine-protein kinase HipA
MSSKTDELVVVLDAPELGRARPVGVLSFWRDSRAVAFAYARSWLNANTSFQIDPRLPLVEGQQYGSLGALPGILADTAPDLWGTMLLERRAGKRLGPWDLLTGVADTTRMGALRLRRGVDGPFIDDRDPGVPPLTQLRALHAAARAIEEDPSKPIGDADIALLITPGSSLGGARPKANYQELDGTLWIAKFPSRSDRLDSGAWEYVYVRLAATAGIAVPAVQLLSLGRGGRTFATKRFDRSAAGRRLFASAMTLTGKADGDPASYLDIAAAIRASGATNCVREDLQQLFRRLVFNVIAGNRDDHLRNHGFIRHEDGWRLAPAFDMNPGREQREHSISLDGSTFAPDVEVALATARTYGLSGTRAKQIVGEVAGAIAAWQEVATAAKIPESEQAIVSGAFRQLESATRVAL